MRKKIVAGNWKMNLEAREAYGLAAAIERFAIDHTLAANHLVVLAPSFVYLEAMGDRMHLIPNIKIAAQNCHHLDNGAYTGEVSASQLKSISVDFVIIGHSERRMYFGERGDVLKAKVDLALRHGMQVIFCCGEPEDVRDRGGHKEYVEAQLNAALFHLGEGQMSSCVIAYEPVWAIGTGKTATDAQAQEMHAYIRFLVEHRYGKATAEATPILYGGSCKPSNAEALFAQPDVDGGLIGGASLDADQFLEIIKIQAAQSSL